MVEDGAVHHRQTDNLVTHILPCGAARRAAPRRDAERVDGVERKLAGWPKRSRAVLPITKGGCGDLGR